jgi:hypothetical protein
MKGKILSIALALALIATMIIPMAALADTSGTVTCTVSAELVSVVITNGTVNYGVVALSGNNDTIGQAGHPTAQNNGSVAEDFTISSSIADGASQDWTLGSTAGNNQFVHNYKVGAGNWTEITSGGVSLASNVSPTLSTVFDLQILMPTATTDYGPHTITVTILATKN